MSRRRTLGGGLAVRIAAVTAGSLLLFSTIAAVAWYLIDEDAGPGQRDNADEERDELIEQLVTAVAIAAPAGIMAAALATRWLTRRATRRIDEVVATAARVSAHDLSARLPVSDAGDELDDLSDALNRMLGRIEAGVAGQRQFAADASHELRTPLTAARSMLEVARRRPRSSVEWETTTDRTLAELTRMSALVDALLLLARSDAAAAVRAPVAIDEVIDRVCESLAPRTTDRKVQLAAAATGGLVVLADAAGLDIALGNLVANAITHSPEAAVVGITAARVANEIRIDVDDHGPGVPAGERDRVFAPFTRGRDEPADRVSQGAGVGLGLPIARRITEAHGGRIEIGDAPGGGARFTLWLPAAAG